MAARGYTSCAIPDGLAQRIEERIGDTRLGYRNRGEFIVDAVRRLLDEYESRSPPANAPSDDIVRRRA